MKTVRRKSSSLASPVPTALAVAAAAPRAGNTARKVFHESRHLTRRAAQASANSEVFTKHESRNTNHGLYASLPTISHDFPAFPTISRPPTPRSRVRTPPGRRFPASCGAAWGGYGAAWAAAVPRAGNTAGWVFTGHETRNMVFPCSSGDSKESNPKPGQRAFHESRDTNHESRPLCICHRFPARCGAAWRGYGAAWVPYGPRARVRAPFAVKSRQCGQNPASHRKMRDVLRSPLLPSPSGLNLLR